MKTYPDRPSRELTRRILHAEAKMAAWGLSGHAMPDHGSQEALSSPEDIRLGILELMRRENIRLVRLDQREKEKLGME